MRVQHNIAAINANRNLTGNNNSVSKSLEKLSSGYRINRAGDDAAGLAISEKMRAQIKCLDQAETNCNDGISLIQTAEGALQEVHSMLNRMTELAEQSANGTYSNEIDRENLQSEVEQLKSEIDRISKSTNFNGINLLDGSLSTTTDANSKLEKGGASISISGGKLAASDTFKFGVGTDGKVTFTKGTGTMKVSTKTNIANINVNLSAASKGVNTLKFTIDDADRNKVSAEDYEKYNGLVITIDTTNFHTASAIASDTVTIAKDGQLELQIGDTADSFNKLGVSIGAMDAKGLGLSSVSVATQDTASDSIKTIKDAINKVSSTRGNLGAMQNRLEHTVNNLSVTNENMTNAESRIRDTDMAKEMMSYTSKNILAQAAQSMLAQANQKPNQVLSLLQ